MYKLAVTKIKMKQSGDYWYHETSLSEIDELYYGGSYHKKAETYDFLYLYPHSLYVEIAPYPDLTRAISSNGEKFVKSVPDYTGKDNLLNLPRE